jgi:hypothetical protein
MPSPQRCRNIATCPSNARHPVRVLGASEGFLGSARQVATWPEWSCCRGGGSGVRGRAPAFIVRMGCEEAIARAYALNRNGAASAAEFLYVK